MSIEVVLGLNAVLTIDGAEIKNVKDLTVSLEKAEADTSTRSRKRVSREKGSGAFLVD